MHTMGKNTVKEPIFWFFDSVFLVSQFLVLKIGFSKLVLKVSQNWFLNQFWFLNFLLTRHLKRVGLGFSKELSTRCRSFHLIPLVFRMAKLLS